MNKTWEQRQSSSHFWEKRLQRQKISKDYLIHSSRNHMKNRKGKHSTKIDNFVNNNPEYDRITRDPEEVAADKEASKNTLYDSSYYKTHAGHWKRNDEPSSDEQLRQSDAINKMMQKRRAAAARQRLKDKNAVPIKRGEKLYEHFMQEALKHKNSNTELQHRKK